MTKLDVQIGEDFPLRDPNTAPPSLRDKFDSSILLLRQWRAERRLLRKRWGQKFHAQLHVVLNLPPDEPRPPSHTSHA